MENIYLPHLAEIVDIKDETPDVKTFTLKFKDESLQKGFSYKPGQFVEVSLFGVGECPIGLSSAPTRPENIQLTVRAVGSVTNALHSCSPGDIIGIRGPFGNGFPLDEFKGQDILIVGGGIGMPPLRSLITNILDERAAFARLIILYGARTPVDLVYKDELKEWENRGDVELLLTVDRADDTWTGRVGVVTTLFEHVKFDPEKTVAFTCGPPIMIKFVIMDLLKLGFPDEQIISTLERYMKCGVGKCGHCAIGHKYVCIDGPVFSYAELKGLGEKE